MTEKSNDDTRLNRRRFLKSASATAAAGFTMAASSGSAAAHPTTVDRVATLEETRGALETRANDVLAALADDGVLDTANAAAFAEAGDSLFRSFDTDRADELRVEREVEGGRLDVAVEPDAGTSYAFYYPDDEDTRYLYRDGERFDLSTEGCYKTDCYCTHTICSAACYEECKLCCSCGDGCCSWERYCDECLC